MTTYTPPAEAVEAAAKAIAENTDEPGWSAVVIARAALTAAGPIIERAVRENVAAEVERYTDATWDLIESSNAARLAFEEVARIARGEGS